MGLFDFISWPTICPTCKNGVARRSLFRVRCSNERCRNFDSFLRDETQWNEPRKDASQSKAPSQSSPTHRNPRTGDLVTRSATQPVPFDIARYGIRIQYVNHESIAKTFEGDWRTLHRKGRHVSLRIAPTGIRIALAISRIQNYYEVDQAIAKCPSRPEARILLYHLKRGTTSPRFEQLRQSYSNWEPW